MHNGNEPIDHEEWVGDLEGKQRGNEVITGAVK